MEPVVLPPYAELKALQFRLIDDEIARTKAVVDFKSFGVVRGQSSGLDTVNDPRLGVCNPRTVCSTCGQSADTCAGHFGKTDLCVPVCSGVAIPVVYKILTCLCVQCGRLLFGIPPAKLAKLLKMDYKRRAKELFDMSLRHRVCTSITEGEPGGFYPNTVGCGAIQPIVWTRETMVLTRPVFNLTDFGGDVSLVPCVSPWRMQCLLNNASDDVSELFGFNPAHSHLRACMQQVQLIPPNNMRPVHKKQGDDDLSFRLKSITKANEKLQKALTPLSGSFTVAGSSFANVAQLELAIAQASEFRLNLSLFVRAYDSSKPGRIEDLEELPPEEELVQLVQERVRLRLEEEKTEVISRELELVELTKCVPEASVELIQCFLHPRPAEQPPIVLPQFTHILPPSSTVAVHIKAKKVVVAPFLNEYFDLQRNVAGYQDRRMMPKLDHDYGRDRNDIRVRFNQGGSSKFCNVRYTLLGKRSDSSGRAVATPGSDLQPDEAGVPQCMCEILTQKDIVTSLNFHEMFQLVTNGPGVYPGANYVERAPKLFTLPNFLEGGLQLGDIVHRHLRDGDTVLINRQPTLHRGSIMAYTVKVHQDSTLRTSLAVTEAMNLDFDGDEINIYVMECAQSLAEAKILMGVHCNVIKNGEILIGPVQHTCLAFYIWTQPDKRFSRSAVQQLLSTTNNWVYINAVWSKLEPLCTETYGVSGRELVRALIPLYDPDRDGVLNKRKLRELLIQCCRAHIWSSREYVRCLGYMIKMGDDFLVGHGATLSVRGCSANVAANFENPDFARLYARADGAERELRELTKLEPYWKTSAASSELGRRAYHLERHVTQLVDRAREEVGRQHVADLEKRHTCLHAVIASGSKGDLSHISQNSGLVGQQLSTEAQRSYYEWVHEKDSRSLEAKGLVTESFLNGLSALSFFLHLCSSRVGLVGTAVLTADTGYLSRKISKALEDLRVGFDNSVRTAMGSVVMVHFGFSAEMLRGATLVSTMLSTAEVGASFHAEELGGPPQPGEPTLSDELSNLRVLRQQLMDLRLWYPQVLVPLDFAVLTGCAVQEQKGQSRELARSGRVRLAVRELWLELVNSFRVPATLQIQLWFFENLSSAKLHQSGVITKVQTTWLLRQVSDILSRNVAPPNEPVGIIGAHSITGPLVQMNLDSPHHSGQSCTLVGGVKRIKEIMNFTKSIKTPSMTLVLNPGVVADNLKLTELLLGKCFTGWVTTQSHCERLKEFGTGLECNDTLSPASTDSWLMLRLDKNVLREHSVGPRRIAEFVVDELSAVRPAAHATVTVRPEASEVIFCTCQLPACGELLCGTYQEVVSTSVLTLPRRQEKSRKRTDGPRCQSGLTGSTARTPERKRPKSSGPEKHEYTIDPTRLDETHLPQKGRITLGEEYAEQEDPQNHKEQGQHQQQLEDIDGGDSIEVASEEDEQDEEEEEEAHTTAGTAPRGTCGVSDCEDNSGADEDEDDDDVDEPVPKTFDADAETDIEQQDEEEDEDPEDDYVIDGNACTPGRTDAALGVAFSTLEEPVWWVAVNCNKLITHGRHPVSSRIRSFVHTLLKSTRLVDGVAGVRGFFPSTGKFAEVHDGKVVLTTKNTVITIGSNLTAVLNRGEFDQVHSSTNDLHEIFHNFGIDAVRCSIEEQLLKAMGKDNCSASLQHVRMVAHSMCSTGQPCALSFSGMTNSNSTNLKKATFERILESFLSSGVSGEYDTLQGTSEAVMVGAKIPLGTGAPLDLIPDNTMVALRPATQPKPIPPQCFTVQPSSIRSVRLRDRVDTTVGNSLLAYSVLPQVLTETLVTEKKLKKRGMCKSGKWDPSKRSKVSRDLHGADGVDQLRSIVEHSDQIFQPSSPTSTQS